MMRRRIAVAKTFSELVISDWGADGKHLASGRFTDSIERGKEAGERIRVKA